MKIDPSMYIPPRAPRLPRDHFAMRPPITPMQRVIQSIAAAASIIALILFVWRHAG